MTNDLLKGIAAQAFNMAKRDLEQQKFNFLLACYHEGDVPPLLRMERIEKVIVERLGKRWLDGGRTKDVGFGILRMANEIRPPDAFILATMVNLFTPSPKLHALSPEQQKEVMDSGHDRHHQAAKEGLLEMCDALWVLAQTPETVCMYAQKLNARGKPDGQPDVKFTPQAEYRGRTKMFGKENPDE